MTIYCRNRRNLMINFIEFHRSLINLAAGSYEQVDGDVQHRQMQPRTKGEGVLRQQLALDMLLYIVDHWQSIEQRLMITTMQLNDIVLELLQSNMPNC